MRFLKGLFFTVFFLIFTVTAAYADRHVKASYASAVKIAAPAVVNVYTDRRIPYRREDISRGYRPYSMSYQDVRRASLGSAVIIDKKGVLLTNYHVVRHATRILVALDDGRKILAKLVGFDQETDLAVLNVNLPQLQSAVLGNSDNIHVGDIVLAIGNPFGLGQTVTQGIVSAIGRSTIGINQLENYIQTDAAINPGNSGGALINTRGEVIGINTGIYSRSGGYQGVGFAIPINIALNVMHQIITTGLVKRGWLGVKIQTVNPQLVRVMRLSRSSGVVIIALLPKSPAAKAGMKKGDVVTHLNRQRIRSARGFLNYIAQRNPGSNVTVIFTRDHKTHRLNITIGTRPPRPMIDGRGRVPVQPGRMPQQRWY